MRNPILAVLLLFVAGLAQAKDVDIEGGSQGEFDAIAEDLVAAIDYKAAGPSEATGLTGFGLGLVTTYVPVESSDWQNVTGSEFDAIGMVGLQATKGLPFNIDVGAFYATAPGSNVDAIGGEIRYAILPGSTVAPAVAVRLSYVTVSGIDDFDLDSMSYDVSVSKGFGPFTPYAGVGRVDGSADPSAAVTTATGIDESEVKETKLFAGARLTLGIIEFTPQYTKLGDANSYTLRMGFSFGL
jgi:hypothetical protein